MSGNNGKNTKTLVLGIGNTILTDDGAGIKVARRLKEKTPELEVIETSESGIRFFDLGLYWGWWIITAWICTLGLIYLARFLQGGWKTKHVIEDKYLPPTAPEPAAIHESERPIDWS